MKVGISDKLVRSISYIFMILFTVFCLYPVVLTFMVSISDEYFVQINGYKLIPDRISFDTYKFIFKTGADTIFRSYTITIFITAIGTMLSIVVTSMLAYVISSKRLRFRNGIAFYCFFTMIINTGIVPFYIVCVKYLQLTNKIYALFIPYLVNTWWMFVLRNYFQSIPDSIFESAKIDGASDFMIYRRIVLPLAKVGLITVSMFYALQFWNDWWLALLFITDNKMRPLQYQLFTLLDSANALSTMGLSVDAGKIKVPAETIKTATTIITIGPIILLYPFIQKYFIKGIMIGAIKG